MVYWPSHKAPAISQKTKYRYKTKQMDRSQRDTHFLVPTLLILTEIDQGRQS